MLLAGGLVTVVMSPESGHLDDFSAKPDVYYSEAAPNKAGISEEGVYFLWCCIGCDIKVFGVAAKQQVANGAAHQIALESLATQSRHNLEGTVANIFAGNAVLIPRYDVQTGIRLLAALEAGNSSITGQSAIACKGG